ncbi:flagellin [Aliarcobacter skirrowii]|uniref:flagellin n=1 Tax=Aliarcobacter skirrowii TaxID=28200 RepID=UPI000AB054BE|nr:flagellin [Aliarcobacter skirrowii]
MFLGDTNMDINAINNTNSIQNLNNLNSNQNIALEKSQLKYSVEDFQSSESTSLAVSKSSIIRSEFSQDIQSTNETIAKTKIAEASMNNLQDFLKNIDQKLQNSENLQNKNDLKQEINQELRDFNQLAFSTKYKDENLIASRYSDDQDSITLSANGSLYSITKPNIANFTNNIFDAINNSDLNNPENLQKAIKSVEDTAAQIGNIANEFENFSKQLIEDVRNRIDEQRYNNNVIDFGKESSDFTKANININAGYLAASQANIVQEQSVRLLS